MGDLIEFKKSTSTINIMQRIGFTKTVERKLNDNEIFYFNSLLKIVISKESYNLLPEKEKAWYRLTPQSEFNLLPEREKKWRIAPKDLEKPYIYSNYKLVDRESVELYLNKVFRLKELVLSNKTSENETVQQALLDLKNYSFLLDCILEEQKLKDNLKNYDDGINWELQEEKMCYCCDNVLNKGQYIYKSSDNYNYCDKVCYEIFMEI